MKPFITVSGVICLILFIIPSVTAIDLTRYTYPESMSQEAYLNGSFNLSDTSDDNDETAYTLGGSALYDLSYRSLPFSFYLNAIGDGSIDKSADKDSDSQDSYSLLINSRANKYFKQDSKLFGFGSTMLNYRKLAISDDADDPYWDVMGGVGYGRVIDATVLKQARRIGEDFKKFGIIKTDIPDDTLIELARIIDRQSEFRSKHGAVEYKKYWYQAMEKVLVEARLINSLGALGTLRIQEVLDEPTGRRYHGWEFRAGAGVVVSDYDGEAGDPIGSVELEYSRPYGMKLQLTNTSYVNTVFESDPSYKLGNNLGLYYEVTTLVDWNNTLGIEYLIPTADELENSITASLVSSCQIYIANQFYFNPSFTYKYIDDGINDSAWDWAIQGGISYRLK